MAGAGPTRPAATGLTCVLGGVFRGALGFPRLALGRRSATPRSCAAERARTAAAPRTSGADSTLICPPEGLMSLVEPEFALVHDMGCASARHGVPRLEAAGRPGLHVLNVGSHPSLPLAEGIPRGLSSRLVLVPSGKFCPLRLFRRCGRRGPIGEAPGHARQSRNQTWAAPRCSAFAMRPDQAQQLYVPTCRSA